MTKTTTKNQWAYLPSGTGLRMLKAAPAAVDTPVRFYRLSKDLRVIEAAYVRNSSHTHSGPANASYELREVVSNATPLY